ncbi:hypothetical protein KJ693_12525, partial [bacterium]|nr:hypothetical protein [bacterium]
MSILNTILRNLKLIKGGEEEVSNLEKSKSKRRNDLMSNLRRGFLSLGLILGMFLGLVVSAEAQIETGVPFPTDINDSISVYQGQQNIVVLDFTLKSTGGDTIDTMIVRNNGTADTDTVAALYLYRDNGNGDFNPASDCLASTATIDVGADTWVFDNFSPANCHVLPAGSTLHYYLVLSVSTPLDAADSFTTFQIVIDTGCITGETGDTNPNPVIDNETPPDVQTIMNQGTLLLDQSSTTTLITAGTDNNWMLTLEFGATGEDIRIDTLPIVFYSTNNNSDTNNIVDNGESKNVKIYQDVGGDSIFTTADVTPGSLISDTVTWNAGINGWIVFLGDNGETVTKGDSVVWHVVFDVAAPPPANIGDTIGACVYGDSVCATGLNSNTTIKADESGPVASDWHYIVGKLTCVQSNENTHDSVTQCQDGVWMQTLKFDADYETMSIDAIVVTNQGTSGVNNIDTIHLYLDDDATYDPLTDPNIDYFGAMSYGADSYAVTLSSSLEVNTGPSTYLHIVYDIPCTATVGNTVRARIVNDTDILAQGGISQTRTNIPNMWLGPDNIALSGSGSSPSFIQKEPVVTVDTSSLTIYGHVGVETVVVRGDDTVTFTFDVLNGDTPGDTLTADAVVSNIRMLFYWDQNENCSYDSTTDVDLNDTTIHWEKVSDNSTGETIASGDTRTITVIYKHIESGSLLSHHEIVRPEIAFYDANVNDPNVTNTNDTTGAHDTACLTIDSEGPINEVHIYGDMGTLAMGDETDTDVLRAGATTAGIVAYILEFPGNLDLNLNGKSGLRANLNAISNPASSNPNDTTTFTRLTCPPDSVTVIDTSPVGYLGMWRYRAIWGWTTNLTVHDSLPEGPVVVYLDYTDSQGISQAGPDDARATAYVDNTDPVISCDTAILRRQGGDVNTYIDRGDTVIIVASITDPIPGSGVDINGVTANITSLNDASGSMAVRFDDFQTVGNTVVCTWIISLASTSPSANQGSCTITARDIAGNLAVTCNVNFIVDGVDPVVTGIIVFSEAGADSTTLNNNKIYDLSKNYNLPDTYYVGTRDWITPYGDNITVVAEITDNDSVGVNSTAFLLYPNQPYDPDTTSLTYNPGDTTLVWIDVSSITKGDLFDPAGSDPTDPDRRHPTALYWDGSKWIAVLTGIKADQDPPTTLADIKDTDGFNGKLYVVVDATDNLDNSQLSWYRDHGPYLGTVWLDFQDHDYYGPEDPKYAGHNNNGEVNMYMDTGSWSLEGVLINNTAKTSTKRLVSFNLTDEVMMPTSPRDSSLADTDAFDTGIVLHYTIDGAGTSDTDAFGTMARSCTYTAYIDDSAASCTVAIWIEAYDRSGNRKDFGSASAPYAVYNIDDTAPVFTNDSETPESGTIVYTTTPTISVNYEDSGLCCISGVDSSTVTMEIFLPCANPDSPWPTMQTITMDTPNYIYDWGRFTVTGSGCAFIPSAEMASGDYSCTVTVADKLGNSDSTTWTFTIEEDPPFWVSTTLHGSDVTFPCTTTLSTKAETTDVVIEVESTEGFKVNDQIDIGAATIGITTIDALNKKIYLNAAVGALYTAGTTVTNHDTTGYIRKEVTSMTITLNDTGTGAGNDTGTGINETATINNDPLWTTCNTGCDTGKRVTLIAVPATSDYLTPIVVDGNWETGTDTTDGQITFTPTALINAGSQPISINILPAGTYEVVFCAIDNAGNTNPVTFGFVVDPYGPTFTRFTELWVCNTNQIDDPESSTRDAYPVGDTIKLKVEAPSDTDISYLVLEYAVGLAENASDTLIDAALWYPLNWDASVDTEHILTGASPYTVSDISIPGLFTNNGATITDNGQLIYVRARAVDNAGNDTTGNNSVPIRLEVYRAAPEVTLTLVGSDYADGIITSATLAVKALAGDTIITVANTTVFTVNGLVTIANTKGNTVEIHVVIAISGDELTLAKGLSNDYDTGSFVDGDHATVPAKNSDSTTYTLRATSTDPDLTQVTFYASYPAFNGSYSSLPTQGYSQNGLTVFDYQVEIPPISNYPPNNKEPFAFYAKGMDDVCNFTAPNDTNTINLRAEDRECPTSKITRISNTMVSDPPGTGTYVYIPAVDGVPVYVSTDDGDDIDSTTDLLYVTLDYSQDGNTWIPIDTSADTRDHTDPILLSWRTRDLLGVYYLRSRAVDWEENVDCASKKVTVFVETAGRKPYMVTPVDGDDTTGLVTVSAITYDSKVLKVRFEYMSADYSDTWHLIGETPPMPSGSPEDQLWTFPWNTAIP